MPNSFVPLQTSSPLAEQGAPLLLRGTFVPVGIGKAVPVGIGTPVPIMPVPNALLEATTALELGKKDEAENCRRTTSRFLLSSAGAAEAKRVVKPRMVVKIAVFIFAGGLMGI